MSAAVASDIPADGRRVYYCRGADGNLYAGGQCLDPKCGPVAHPGVAVDGRRRDRLAVYVVYRGERHRHTDNAVAGGPLRAEGWFFKFQSSSSRSGSCWTHLRLVPSSSCSHG